MNRSGETALERLEFLIASPNRYRLLRSLSEGAASSDTLGEELDLPRSTLRRNLTALENQGYISQVVTENRYEVTVAGEIACKAVRNALSTVELGASVGPFFERFPAELPIGPDTLMSCDITISTTDTPFEPLYHVRRNVMGAACVKGFVPTINPLYIDTLQECIDEDLTLEVVAPPSGYESASPDYDETLDAIGASENITLYESGSVPEYALGIIDETVLLGAFDERMRTHSVIAAPSQSELRRWAAERYDEIKATATPR
ncbi:helix-turn-helix domain-containing protein [Haloarcula hispanica]|uniref:ArsR family transcriptional regulator n=1 Tax=Haloarcula hispanica TaxID=51589 RepID=A0A482T9U6_HALHI|nr:MULTISPECIES: helix-turn-helix domain-containing protein [Haloarcula]MCJ0618910.1 helix-turn-helix domain-containing protein [Haloarcula hispanica]RLM33914.1 ArsR family transcriptional regulator [Haloarcula sp. Atlit-120R]RLM42514.1 ArsR family transcriptional regulator [Haloarcula sp. Atlit-47R]RLM95956.1 ArsR family transcriptional regulator [Haloarcula sp. Atlit-7R]RYJ09455.1 ArsR family transcriptional regulator [Haloarcula hispanica]